jgi:hypothetical protein
MDDSLKVRIYEALIHKLQMCVEVTHDHAKGNEIIVALCNWSYAHRSGELSNKERAERIKVANNRLRKLSGI